MANEIYKNDSATTLNGGINDSVTSITVTDGSVFPATGNFRIKIDSEIMLVTARSTHVLTVTRGVETTTAASHSDLAAVTHIITATSLVNVANQLNDYGALSSRPTAGIKGRIYRPTDSLYQQYDTGSVWRNMYRGMVLDKTIPSSATLLAGSWAWVNQGSATITDTDDGFHITQPTSSGENIRGIFRAVPSTPYSFVVGLQGTFPSSQYYRAGIAWYDGTKYHTWCLQRANTTCPLQVDQYTNATTYGSTTFNIQNHIDGVLFLKITDDGTNRSFWSGPDLQNWTEWLRVTRTTHLTPTHYGIFGNNANSSFSGTKTKIFYLDEF